ncbi:MAG: bifunctional demethylmenaquinone methyltransferase/2-methoxy-6-polyprenyl-1,4-benzoquinol methylase UbiE [Campylobacter sp.]|nr:bifunctional demethylmenaquinone methyltransferase/2-methoxy-6-polyprenyl-1,4-benzoquinol methylase UbiE [Campylobacter sp.]
MKNQSRIIDMFNGIAPTYDKANRIMSFGLDVQWRKDAVASVLAKYVNSDIAIADIACGTGDMMGLWHERAKGYGTNIIRLVGIDPSSGMLEVARTKYPEFEFIESDATNSTLKSSSIDAISISYGIRNVVERIKALEEFNRILKVGGYLVVLEFTKPKKGGFASRCRDFYISKILPKIGEKISKNREAYEYLPDSIGDFLDIESFRRELENAGFKVEISKSYSFDVSTLFLAQKVRDL